MRRVAAALALLVVMVPAAAARGGATAVPKLHVVRLHPFTVKGTGFPPHRRVTVTLVTGKRWSVQVSVAASGTFTATLRHATIPKCSAYTLRAVVPHTKAAVIKAPACASKKKPSASLVISHTVHVVGHSFEPSERITATLTANGQTWTRRARATASGSFSVDYSSIPLNSCDEYTLKVVGSSGSRFSSEHPQVPC